MTFHKQLPCPEETADPYGTLTRFLLDAELDDLIAAAPMLCRYIPKLAQTVKFDQHSPHHAYDVYTHICHVTAAVPRQETLRWAALLHDVGKPASFTRDETGRGHFKGHAQVGAAMASEILRGLNAPQSLVQDAVWLIDHHMMPLYQDEEALHRLVRENGRTRTEQLLTLKEADACSKGTTEKQAETISRLHELRQWLNHLDSGEWAAIGG